ncbi:MAG: T9SS type A sorting domain-containing protein [Calditrichaeota bacterium]|nr:T9SS type A sorting domain-containing protein [Calditrichota bacterium]
MKHQKLTIIFLIIFSATTFLFGGTILRIGSGTGQAGGEGYALPIILQNDRDVAGLQFTIQDAQNALHIDSVVATSRANGWVAMHNENNLLLFDLRGKPIPAGEGEIATLFLHIDSTAAAGSDTLRTVATPLLADTLGERIDTTSVQPGVFEIQFPTLVSAKNGKKSLPLSYALKQNYPNPFNPTTTIRFALPEPGRTVVEIYNTLGEKVRTLADQELKAGYHVLHVNAAGLAAGIYFYEISVNDFIAVRKMALIK